MINQFGNINTKKMILANEEKLPQNITCHLFMRCPSHQGILPGHTKLLELNTPQDLKD